MLLLRRGRRTRWWTPTHLLELLLLLLPQQLLLLLLLPRLLELRLLLHLRHARVCTRRRERLVVLRPPQQPSPWARPSGHGQAPREQSRSHHYYFNLPPMFKYSV